MHGREQTNVLEAGGQSSFHPLQRLGGGGIYHEVAMKPLRESGHRGGNRRLVAGQARHQSGAGNAVPVQFARPNFGQILRIRRRSLPSQDAGDRFHRRLALPWRRTLLLRRQGAKEIVGEEMDVGVVDG